MQTDLFNQNQPISVQIPELIANWVIYDSNWLPLNKADNLFAQLQRELSWQQPEITVFGKAHRIPRLQYWCADPGVVYQYSGKTLVSQPWHPALLKVREDIAAKYGHQFNTVLVNYYRDGNDKMGWHADDEVELGANPVIASLSLGAERDIQFQHKGTKDTATLSLHNGSLLLMKVGMQKTFKHQIPMRKRVSSGRISLTFRKIL